jgi:hypothetical protein
MRLRSLSCLFFGALASAPAHATDWYTGAAGRGVSSSRPSASFDLSLSGTTQASVHGVGIGRFTPYGFLDQSGMRLRLAATIGTFTYMSTVEGVGEVRGDQGVITLLGGYEWVAPTMTAAVYGGLDVWRNSFDKFDPSNETGGTTMGFKLAADVYVNPTRFTMASANVTFSTAHQSYYGRFKVGMAVTEKVFIGPELVAIGDSFSQQYRMGVHVSGLRVGPLQFGLAGGYMSDRMRGSGGYGTLDTRLAF